jgi:hypothetical protein
MLQNKTQIKSDKPLENYFILFLGTTKLLWSRLRIMQVSCKMKLFKVNIYSKKCWMKSSTLPLRPARSASHTCKICLFICGPDHTLHSPAVTALATLAPPICAAAPARRLPHPLMPYPASHMLYPLLRPTSPPIILVAACCPPTIHCDLTSSPTCLQRWHVRQT